MTVVFFLGSPFLKTNKTKLTNVGCYGKIDIIKEKERE